MEEFDRWRCRSARCWERGVDIVSKVREFVQASVRVYLENPEAERVYPAALVREMAELGLFGLNVPAAYGGLEADLATIVEVTRVLSQGWLCLPSIVGSHMRAAPYIQAVGTDRQKAEFLPKLARGELVVAHGYSESRLSTEGRLRTELVEKEGRFVLNGCKGWVTNARDADRILVIARSPLDSLCAVWVRRGESGLELVELDRPGMLGVSLSRLILKDYPVDPEDILGGPESCVRQVLAESGRPKALAFAARAVGAGATVVEETRRLIEQRTGRAPLHPVALQRWGRVLLDFEASRSLFERAVEGSACPVSAKVFCGECLRRMVENAMALCGGDGYATQRNVLGRLFREAPSLTLAGSSNDVLLSRIASEDLAS